MNLCQPLPKPEACLQLFAALVPRAGGGGVEAAAAQHHGGDQPHPRHPW